MFLISLIKSVKCGPFADSSNLARSTINALNIYKHTYWETLLCVSKHLWQGELFRAQGKERTNKFLRKAEEEGLPARIWERVVGNSAFQRMGPIEAKNKDWTMDVLVWET